MMIAIVMFMQENAVLTVRRDGEVVREELFPYYEKERISCAVTVRNALKTAHEIEKAIAEVGAVDRVDLDIMYAPRRDEALVVAAVLQKAGCFVV